MNHTRAHAQPAHVSATAGAPSPAVAVRPRAATGRGTAGLTLATASQAAADVLASARVDALAADVQQLIETQQALTGAVSTLTKVLAASQARSPRGLSTPQALAIMTLIALLVQFAGFVFDRLEALGGDPAPQAPAVTAPAVPEQAGPADEPEPGRRADEPDPRT